MKFFQSPQFKTLETEWYRKLKDEGFPEIEKTGVPSPYLQVWHSLHFKKTYTADEIKLKSAYFDAAREFLHLHPFGSDLERDIWERHANGMSIRKIASSLNTKPCRVYKVIRALIAEMRKGICEERA